MKISINNYNNYTSKTTGFNNIIFGQIQNKHENQQFDSFNLCKNQVSFTSGQLPKNQEQIRKFISLISSKEKKCQNIYQATNHKFSPSETSIAISKGYEGQQLIDFASGLQEGLDEEEAQIYTDNNLSGFYGLYKQEFEENPYKNFLPSSVVEFMKKENFSPVESVYAIGYKMDTKTRNKFKAFLAQLKSKTQKGQEVPGQYIKSAAELAVESYKRDKENKRIDIMADLIFNQGLPANIADAVSKSPALLKRIPVIKSMFPANENSEEYRIKPAHRISGANFMKIITNPIITDNFDRFAGLISVDKKTNKPVCRGLRALDLNEAYAVVKYNLPNRELNNFIFYCNCGIEPNKAVNMLLNDND